MTERDDDRFEVRPGSPKARPPRFVSQVIREVDKAGGRIVRRASGRPGARLGRGHAASRLAGRSMSPQSRRVTVKARLVNLRRASVRSTAMHLRYIERDGIGRDDERGRAYGSGTDEADLTAFEERGRGDRHQFRFIVSAEEGEQLRDLRRYTRGLMNRMEADLGTRLDWVAVDHWDTDNPHTHIVLRGKDEAGRDLVIAGDYIAHGMRERASELATEWLGPRTEREIQHSHQREVEQDRWTGLDRALQRESRDGLIRFDQPPESERQRQQRTLSIGRLQHLKKLGLATQHRAGVWSMREDAELVLRASGEREDIIRTMQRAMGGAQRELAIFESSKASQSIIGTVAGKGLADELNDHGYLVIDGIDGRSHYVTLNAGADLGEFPIGAIVEAKAADEARVVDTTIAATAVDGFYTTDRHLEQLRRQTDPKRDPEQTVTAHVRRLEALRRAGIVERTVEGVWKIPDDLSEQGRRYDAQRRGGIIVELRTHLPIERQTKAIGATWLDSQLVASGGVGVLGIAESGFGGEVRQALRHRTDFLIEQGLAGRKGQRLILTSNLLGTLRQRDIETAAKAITAESGLTHHPVAEGQRITGMYRRSVQLVSGRFAMLDTGAGFSLVPWRPVVEKWRGHAVTADIRFGGVAWSLGRQRGPTVS